MSHPPWARSSMRVRPGGVALLVDEAPEGPKARRIAAAVTDALAAGGFSTTTAWADTPSLVGVTARR